VLDKVFVVIEGTRHCWWRAVDQDDYILVILVQSRRHKQVAQKFFRPLCKDFTAVSRVINIEKLKSSGTA